MVVTDLVFELWATKTKLKGVFTGSLVAMVTYYANIINESYIAIIRLSTDTILLSLSDTKLFNNSIKRQAL